MTQTTAKNTAKTTKTVNTAEARREHEKEARQAKYFNFVNSLNLNEFAIEQTHYTEDNPEAYHGMETEILNHHVEKKGTSFFKLESLKEPKEGDLENLARFALKLFPNESEQIRLFIKIVFGGDFLSSANDILKRAKRKKSTLAKVNAYLQGLSFDMAGDAMPVSFILTPDIEKSPVFISSLEDTEQETEDLFLTGHEDLSLEKGFFPEKEIVEIPVPLPIRRTAAHADGLSRQMLGYDAKQKKALINEELNASKGKKPSWFNICLKWQKINTWEELQEARKNLPDNKGLKNLFFNKIYNPKKEEIIREQINADEFYKRVEDFFKRCIASQRELSPKTKQTFKRVKFQIVKRKPPQPMSNYLFNLRKEVEKLN